MTPEERAVREKLQNVVTEQRRMLDAARAENRAFTPDEQTTYNQMNVDKQELRAKVQVYSEAALIADEEAELRTSMGEIIAPTIDPSNNPANRTDDDKAVERRAAFLKCMQMGDERSIEEYRALQQDNATQAGYLVMEEQFVAEIIQELDDKNFIRKMSRTFTLKKAQSMGFPKKTAGSSTFARGTEIGAPTADSSLAFGKREFIPRPVTGEIVVSKTLLRNGAMDIDAYVRGEIATERWAFEESEYMTGSGAAGEALGLFTASDNGISTDRDVSTGNEETELTAAGLKEAKWKLKTQYRKGAKWLFHRDGVKKVDTLVDANGRYLWQDSMVEGEPGRLLGYPVVESEKVPNTFTTGLYVGLLGNFKYYWIVDALNWELQVLKELYARSNQWGFLCRFEFDAMPVLEEAFVRVTMA